jgi:hypothetical protein
MLHIPQDNLSMIKLYVFFTMCSMSLNSFHLDDVISSIVKVKKIRAMLNSFTIVNKICNRDLNYLGEPWIDGNFFHCTICWNLYISHVWIFLFCTFNVFFSTSIRCLFNQLNKYIWFIYLNNENNKLMQNFKYSCIDIYHHKHHVHVKL